MTELDGIIQDAVQENRIPFVCAGVSDSHGTRWSGNAGMASGMREAQSDTVFRMFSATKAIGAVAALIGIDRQLFDLDTPVGDLLPAFDKLEVLERVTPTGLQTRPPRTRATLRNVLTHTQGQGYDAYQPLMIDYRAATGAANDLSLTRESLNYPLLFDPGQGFAYGIGADWVGAMIEAADGRGIHQFVSDELLEPLGMHHTVFEVEPVRDLLADLRLKTSAGVFEPFELSPPSKPDIYHMGNALYSTAEDYLSFLRLILNRGAAGGAQIVSEQTMELAFSAQLGLVELPTPLLSSHVPFISHDVDLLPGSRMTHTAVSFMNVDGLPGRRSAGSLSWGGVHNTLYWVDPAADVAAVFFTQMLPFWDPELVATFEDFERAVYRGL